jgi:hypothetical protein
MHLVPKLDKSITRKELFNKMLVNQAQHHMQIILHLDKVVFFHSILSCSKHPEVT